jgi:hypothetical protein
MADKHFGARDTLRLPDGTEATIYRLSALEEAGLCKLDALPYTIRVLLEAAVRNHDGFVVRDQDVLNLAGWTPQPKNVEVPFLPARVVLQDFTGVPCVVDMAALRNAMVELGGDPAKVNPLVPVDLVIDHSVQVDVSGRFADAAERNVAHGVRAQPRALPVPQVGPGQPAQLPRRAPRAAASSTRSTWSGSPTCAKDTGADWVFPDSCRRHRQPHHHDQRPRRARLGRRRHRGRGRDARPARLHARCPRSSASSSRGKLKPGRHRHRHDAPHRPDAAQARRRRQVRRVLRPGDGRPEPRRPRHHRQHGPRVRRHLRLLPGRRGHARVPALTGRDEAHVQNVEAYWRAQGLFWTPDSPEPSSPTCSSSTSAGRALAGRPQAPARPGQPRQDEAALGTRCSRCRSATRATASTADQARRHRARGGQGLDSLKPRRRRDRGDHELHQHLEPERDDRRGPRGPQGPRARLWPSPGSRPASRPARASSPSTTRQGRACSTTSKRSASRPSATAARPASATPAPRARDRGRHHRGQPGRVASVLSGNRNFEGRVHPAGEGQLPRQPAAGRRLRHRGHVDIDFRTEPLGHDTRASPSSCATSGRRTRSSRRRSSSVDPPEMFRKKYGDVTEEPRWDDIPVAAWRPLRRGTEQSTYIQQPTFFQGLSAARPDQVDHRRRASCSSSATRHDRPHQPRRRHPRRTARREPTCRRTASRSRRTSTATARGAATTR